MGRNEDLRNHTLIQKTAKIDGCDLMLLIYILLKYDVRKKKKTFKNKQLSESKFAGKEINHSGKDRAKTR